MSRSALVSPPSKEEDDATISSYVKSIVSTADDLSRMRSYNERNMDTILSTSPRIPTPSTSSSSSSTSRLFSSNTATLYYNAMKAKNSTNSNNKSSNSNNKAITWINKSDDDTIASLEQRKEQDKKEKNKKKNKKKKNYVSGSSKIQWDNREVSEKLRLEIKADMDKVGDTLDLKKTKKSSSSSSSSSSKKEKEKKSSKTSDTTTKSTKVSSKKKMDGDTNKEVSEKLRLEIKTDIAKFDDKFDLKKKKKKKIVSDNAATSSCDTNPNKSNKEVIDNNSDKDLTLSAAHHYASVYKELTSMSQSRLASRLGMPTTTPSSSNVSVSNSPSSAEPSNNIKDEFSVVTQPPASTIKRSNSNSSIATEAPASTPEKKQQSSKQSSSTLDVKKQTTISEWVEKSTNKPTANQTPTLDPKKQTTISEWVEKSRMKPVTFGSTSKTKPVLLKGILKSKKKATSDAAAKPAATFSAVADLKGTEITVSSQVLTKFDNQWQEMVHHDKQWKVYLKTKEEEGTEIPVSAEFLAEIDDKWRKKMESERQYAEIMELERQYAEIRNSLVSSSLQGHVEEETSKDYCGMSSPLGIFCGEDAIKPSATSKADRHQAEVAQLISLGKIEAHLTKKRAEREAATKDAIKVDAIMLESKSSYDHALRNELLNWKSKADDETPAADKSNVERKIESDKDEDNQANDEESDKLLEVVYEILKEEESNKFKHLNDKTKEAIKAKNRSVIIPKLLRKIKEDGDAAANVPKTIAVVTKEENSDDSTTPTVATVSTAESGQSESSCNMGFVGDFMREMKDWLILLGPERCGGDESRGMATIPFEPEEQKINNVLSWSDIDGRWNKV